jgi:hypothetical protein
VQSDDDTVILKLAINAAAGSLPDPCGGGEDGAVMGCNKCHGPDPYNTTILDGHTAFESHPAAAEGPLISDRDVAAPSSAAASSKAPSSAATSKVVRLLADFQEKSKVGEWPTSTQVHCYWCCHAFTTPPMGLPIRYLNDRFYVTGCFCSLECAAA